MDFPIFSPSVARERSDRAPWEEGAREASADAFSEPLAKRGEGSDRTRHPSGGGEERGITPTSATRSRQAKRRAEGGAARITPRRRIRINIYGEGGTDTDRREGDGGRTEGGRGAHGNRAERGRCGRTGQPRVRTHGRKERSEEADEGRGIGRAAYHIAQRTHNLPTQFNTR